MLNSIECRAPFLNKKLWDYTSRLDDNLLIRNFNKKYILKESFKKYFPRNFFNNPKQGFGVPVGDWLRSTLKKELISFINPKLIAKQNIFNYSQISKLVYDHINKRNDNTFKIWSFYCFQKWYINTYN
tara:strand:- start:248 stop:631 length:384 start_codon:yes stop_codon:yes gene_type:complete